MNRNRRNKTFEHTPNVWALLPLGVFLLSYLVVSCLAGDFYKMPITVAFVISSAVAILISKGGELNNRIEQFCKGAANSNIMLMVIIFILAGAFAQTAKEMGAVDATVGWNIYRGLFYLNIRRNLRRHYRSSGTCSRRYRGKGRDAGCLDAGCCGEWCDVRR